jgi:hypothetical protein
MAAATFMLAGGTVVPAAGALAAGATLAMVWGSSEHGRRSGSAARERDLAAAERPSGDVESRAIGAPEIGVAPAPDKRPAMPGDPDLYLDLDAVEVQAVYLMGSELFTQLTGGVGQRKDLVTGDRLDIETTDVSLTWRCTGRRTAERLAAQLNTWEANHTPLRLLAACGRSALLMEDDHNWLLLPELRQGQ